MCQFILALFFFVSSQALVLEPIFEAAENLGYHVVGEVEFKKGASQPNSKAMEENLEELGGLCPRTQAHDRRISSQANFVIMAWPDHEFPSQKIQNLTPNHVALAQSRAAKTVEYLRRNVKGNLRFEMVNMATRQPHFIPISEYARMKAVRTDIKAALEQSGAAPTNAYAIGLFGEYAQRSKAVIWVDCHESLVKRRPNAIRELELAWGKIPRLSESILDARGYPL